jgi:hypothetical protein
MQNNSVAVDRRGKEIKQLFLVVDKDFTIRLNDMKSFIKEECGDTMTYNELMHKIREYLDEDKFIDWLDALKVVKKGEKLSPTSKQKIIKILKGGK